MFVNNYMCSKIGGKKLKYTHHLTRGCCEGDAKCRVQAKFKAVGKK